VEWGGTLLGFSVHGVLYGAWGVIVMRGIRAWDSMVAYQLAYESITRS
jgi:hypothetical protein